MRVIHTIKLRQRIINILFTYGNTFSVKMKYTSRNKIRVIVNLKKPVPKLRKVYRVKS